PFGGIITVNRELDLATAQAIDEILTEIIIALSYSDGTLDLLTQKKNRRLIRHKKRFDGTKEQQFRYIFEGTVSQQNDSVISTKKDLKVVSERQSTDQEIKDMLFSWKVSKHVKSNAIVYGRDRQTIGIGTGQTSRVEASE